MSRTCSAEAQGEDQNVQKVIAPLALYAWDQKINTICNLTGHGNRTLGISKKLTLIFAGAKAPAFAFEISFFYPP